MNKAPHAAAVAQIIPRLDTGGAELATLEMCRAVVKAGGRSVVFTEGGRLEQEIREAGGEIVRVPAGTKNPLLMIVNALRLARFFKRRGIDLIHARSRAPAWSALWAARLTGTPLVTTYHGAYGNSGPLKPFYNSVMARGNLIIANSSFTARLITERHGTPPEQIRVIQRGVDLDKFDPETVSAERIEGLRDAWGVSWGEKIVLHAARLTEWKGQHDVIEAAARICASGNPQNAVFLLVGDAQGRDSYVEDLKRRIAGHGLEDKVRLTGHCDDMPAAFAAAHVALVASREPEAFGRVSAEAQAMGCPVVVTRQGASPETILTAEQDGADNATGWVVPVGAPRELANAIAEALTLSARERRALGQRARENVARKFTTESMQRETLGVYDECLRTALVAAYDDATKTMSGD